MSDRTRKLVSIRHNDHDLLVLVSRELDRGFALVDVATTRTSPLLAQAQKAYDTAGTILPRISDLGEDDRLHLESRLKELRLRLDQVPAFARVERYTDIGRIVGCIGHSRTSSPAKKSEDESDKKANAHGA